MWKQQCASHTVGVVRSDVSLVRHLQAKQTNARATMFLCVSSLISRRCILQFQIGRKFFDQDYVRFRQFPFLYPKTRKHWLLRTLGRIVSTPLTSVTNYCSIASRNITNHRFLFGVKNRCLLGDISRLLSRRSARVVVDRALGLWIFHLLLHNRRSLR